MNIDPLTATQLAIIGVVATVAVQAIRFTMAQKKGIKLGRRPVTLGLYVIAIVLASIFTKPILPVFPAFPAPVEDPSIFASLVILFFGQVVVFLGQLIAVASGIVGFATTIYNLLLQRVFEALGWSVNPPKTEPQPEAPAPIGG